MVQPAKKQPLPKPEVSQGQPGIEHKMKNKPVYIAYWSSSGPFHCSFETWPGDGRAHWVDSKAGTVINLIKGTMRIERNGDKYYIHADEVDRMPYCGTFGLITGVLTVPTKKGRPCDWNDMSADDGNVLGAGGGGVSGLGIHPIAVRAVYDVAARVVPALGFDGGFFNVEFFVHDAGPARIIEVNARISSQFWPLVQAVDGRSTYEALFDHGAFIEGHLENGLA